MASPALPRQRAALDHSSVDLFDEAALLPSPGPAQSGIRLPDGRALTWSDYGSPRGLPCLVLPDAGSSRLAPRWLLHDAALPAAVRMIAIDRPGVGGSDPIGFGGREDPADDLRHVVDTLAVGRVAVVGIGHGANDALAFACRYPFLVTSVLAVSPRLRPERPARRHLLRLAGRSASPMAAGPVMAWLDAAGTHGDLAAERTWSKAVRKMDEPPRAVLGERWREVDFRTALAADLNESLGSWTVPATPPEQIEWATAPTTAPVHIWHGRDDVVTSTSEVRALVERRATWQCSVVDGYSAVFGAWPEILAAAAGSFRTVAA
jgi:pimeloyl-ACP methyl ester carboxylesterase